MRTKTLELDAEAVDTLLSLLRAMSERSFSALEEMQESGRKIDPAFALEAISVHTLYNHVNRANKKFEVAELEKIFVEEYSE
jgi:hypothetical protein